MMFYYSLDDRVIHRQINVNIDSMNWRLISKKLVHLCSKLCESSECVSNMCLSHYMSVI